MRSERTINREVKTPGGITNVLTKQTPVYKILRHVTFQGMINKEIILAETIFKRWFEINFD